MTASNPMPDQDRVVAEIEIAAPPERVFQALTDQKQLFHWWGKEPSVELTRTAAGTRVRVTHSGLRNEPISRKDYGQGWEGVLRLLEQYFR